MDINIIIGIFSGLIAFWSLFFVAIPFLKNFLRKQVLKNIRFFYERYRLLNPFLGFEYNKITSFLKSQSLCFYGFSMWFVFLKDHETKYDLFHDNNNQTLNLLSIRELWKILFFWRNCNKKMKKIFTWFSNWDYLCNEEEDFNNFGSVLSYKNNFNGKIKRTSISICPEFDSTRLYGSRSMTYNYQENIIDFKEIFKIKHNNAKILKNIRSNNYSINIEFKNSASDNRFSFSLNFDGANLINIETFYHFNQTLTINKEEAEEFKNCCLLIKKAFKIKDFEGKFEKIICDEITEIIKEV